MHPALGVFHLELHTPDLARACELYARLCGWSAAPVPSGDGTYWALGLGQGGLRGGGVVESSTPTPLWLPYVGVDDIHDATERASGLGAQVMVEPREGPAGWRTVVAVPAGGPLALWQAKEQR